MTKKLLFKTLFHIYQDMVRIKVTFMDM